MQLVVENVTVYGIFLRNACLLWTCDAYRYDTVGGTNSAANTFCLPPRNPVSMLSVSSMTTELMNLHLDDGMSERTQRGNADVKE